MKKKKDFDKWMEKQGRLNDNTSIKKKKKMKGTKIKEQSWAKMNEKDEKSWDDFRNQYNGIIKNLLNNIDICNRRYAEEGEGGYLTQRDVYIKEIEEIKTFVKKKEIELGYYSNE